MGEELAEKMVFAREGRSVYIGTAFAKRES